MKDLKQPLVLLLDKLIAEAPPEDKGAVALQVQIGGAAYAGSIKHSTEHDGLYELISVNPQQRMAVSIYFAPQDLTAVFIPKESPVMQPSKSGIIVPRDH